VTKLAIDSITIDPTVQIRRSNHEPTIRRYEESFDKLPPVDVFDTPEGLLLADGFHRSAAAQRLGLAEIEANVHKGTRADALEFAVISNTKNADPLTPDERDDGIRRLRQLHPDWSQRQIADAMSVSQSTVRRVFQIDEVKTTTFRSESMDSPSDSHYREIARAPREHWQPLVRAAQKRDWTVKETADAARALRDEAVPAEHKQELIQGEADPLIRRGDGSFAVSPDTVSRHIAQARANDAILAFQRALEHLGKARLFKAEAIFGAANAEMLDYWEKELPGDIAFLNEVLSGTRESRTLRVVRGQEA
jgi:ParB-like chromosome segregation protein Spo0J